VRREDNRERRETRYRSRLGRLIEVGRLFVKEARESRKECIRVVMRVTARNQMDWRVGAIWTSCDIFQILSRIDEQSTPKGDTQWSTPTDQALKHCMRVIF
jgi:hypothetical protein